MKFTQTKDTLRIEFEDSDKPDEKRLAESYFNVLLMTLRLSNTKKDRKIKETWKQNDNKKQN